MSFASNRLALNCHAQATLKPPRREGDSAAWLPADRPVRMGQPSPVSPRQLSVARRTCPERACAWPTTSICRPCSAAARPPPSKPPPAATRPPSRVPPAVSQIQHGRGSRGLALEGGNALHRPARRRDHGRGRHRRQAADTLNRGILAPANPPTARAIAPDCQPGGPVRGAATPGRAGFSRSWPIQRPSLPRINAKDETCAQVVRDANTKPQQAKARPGDAGLQLTAVARPGRVPAAPAPALNRRACQG